MPLVVPEGGERKILELIINKSSPSQLTIRLYSSPVDFSGGGLGIADFQEPEDASYSPIDLLSSSWSVATVGGVSAATYASSVEFSFEGASDLYGYYVTDSAGVVMWAEAFSTSPLSIPAAGGKVRVRPRLQLN
jgi:hypothetical protein